MSETGKPSGEVTTPTAANEPIAAPAAPPATPATEPDFERKPDFTAHNVEEDKAAEPAEPAWETTAETGAGATETLLQEVIDFLHRIFPGHGAPGKPSTAPADDPAAPMTGAP